MPAHALTLKAREPEKRPPGIPDGLWYFPRNLADAANARGLSPAEVAEMAGVTPPTISRWLRYRAIDSVPVSSVMLLEEKMGLPHGALTMPPMPFAAKRGA